MTDLTTSPGIVAGTRKAARRRMPRRSRRGLINVLLTVAIVAGVILGIIQIYAQVNGSIRTQTVQSTLTTAESEIRRLYSARPQYDGNITPVIEAAMPDNALAINGAVRTIVTPFGGVITAGGGATVGTTTTASNNRFWLRVNELPESACETVAASYLDRDNVVAVRVAATNAVPTDPMADLAEIGTDCTNADVNTVGIVFSG